MFRLLTLVITEPKGLKSFVMVWSARMLRSARKSDPLDLLGLPQPPDDLEGRVGLARARRHREEHAALAPRDRLHRPLDGDALVVAGLLAGRVLVVGLPRELLGLVGEPLPGAVAAPKLVGGRELVEAELSLDRGRAPGSVVEQERIAVRREDEGHIERLGVAEGLLHPAAHGVVVVFGLDDREGQVRLVEEQIVGPLPLAPARELASDDDAARREAVLAADLRELVPARLRDRRSDVVLADFGFVQGFLIAHHALSSPRLVPDPVEQPAMHYLGVRTPCNP